MSANKIKQIRLEKRLTQYALAKKNINLARFCL